LAGCADEWSPLLVLVKAGPLADEHDLGFGAAFAGNGLSPRLAQLAQSTGANIRANEIQ
jgi:hypothetical protein